VKSPAGRRLKIGVLILAFATTGCLPPPAVEEPSETPLSSRSRIFAADGTLLATLFVENREPIGFKEIPPIFIDAVVAAEDQRYWSHGGVDLKAIARAALRNLSAGQAVQGGSTITQQYVKNVYFPIERPRTFQQKLIEAQLAWRLEQRYSKEEILERYLNTVYFGDGAYGIKAASERFFAKPPQELTLTESALLAGVIRSPEADNPRRNEPRAQGRRNYVISRMRTLEMITPLQAEEAIASPLGLRDPPVQIAREPHFVEYVKQAIAEDPTLGSDESERAALLYRGGIDVHTSLDPHLQEIARNAINRTLGRPGDPEAALVALDPKTGKVLAMVGGRDFEASQVNLALGRKGGGSGRQPGSAFKTFVLTAAIEDGIRPDAVYSSSPPSIRVSRTELWQPRNSEGRGYGPMSVETATIFSVNAVFARLGMDVGPGRVAGMAGRMGISADLAAHPSISLGSEEVSVLDMASGYGTLANYGIQVPPSPIVRIDLPGSDSLTSNRQPSYAIDPGTAWLVTDILTKVIGEGTGTRAKIDRPAAGKTGTSQDFADAWFVGYTPDLVTAVWVGYPSGRVPMTNVHGTRVFGGTFPATIWRIFMEQALAGKPASIFDIPVSSLVEVEIDPATGLLAGPHCAGRQTVQMLKQLMPTHSCPAPPPSPTPEPSPEVSPTPSSEPSPEPSPQVSPEPSPKTSPAPSPQSSPAPSPQSSPEPSPAPSPSSLPSPG
jgi:penicillin-binding protein 1A